MNFSLLLVVLLFISLISLYLFLISCDVLDEFMEKNGSSSFLYDLLLLSVKLNCLLLFIESLMNRLGFSGVKLRFIFKIDYTNLNINLRVEKYILLIQLFHLILIKKLNYKNYIE